ncbi:RING finger protein B [Spatholobus suberectus]|nr:RING finger protein B [Spatholobus suberectus]
MLVGRRVMSWRRVTNSLKALVAHGFLFFFTLLLVLKLDHQVHQSWWIIFSPLWIFHAVVARGRFSLPAPLMPHDRHWAPCHAILATPLLVAFELLLCIHLESNYAVNLEIVFLPLLAFEMAILIDNIRMCKALVPRDDESISGEAIRETLPYLLIAVSMGFFIAATLFTLLKIRGDIGTLGWWDLLILLGIAECFAFFVCTKWHNPTIHENCHVSEHSSSFTIRYLDRGIVVSSDVEDRQQNSLCNLQDIGGHIMKIPFIGFQILLFMHLTETPSSAKNIPMWVIFSPLFLLQGAGVLFAAYRLVEKIVLLLYSGDAPNRYTTIASKIRDCFRFIHHGSRFLGWWSTDEGSKEERARLYCAGSSGYNTFSPDAVKKMHREHLVEEIWRLQAALGTQTEVAKLRQEEYERLQNEKILCRVCFEKQINIVLLPCRHHILCSTCCQKCKRCPICRVFIEERIAVFEA